MSEVSFIACTGLSRSQWSVSSRMGPRLLGYSVCVLHLGGGASPCPFQQRENRVRRRLVLRSRTRRTSPGSLQVGQPDVRCIRRVGSPQKSQTVNASTLSSRAAKGPHLCVRPAVETREKSQPRFASRATPKCGKRWEINCLLSKARRAKENRAYATATRTDLQ